MEENIKTEKNQEVQEDKKGFRIGDLFQGHSYTPMETHSGNCHITFHLYQQQIYLPAKNHPDR